MSVKEKKKRIRDLAALDSEKLIVAAHVLLYAAGDRLKSRAVKDIATKPRGSLMPEARNCENSEPFTAEEALGLFIQCKLTQRSYKKLRYHCKQRGHDLIPAYEKMVQAKKVCCPREEDLYVDETRAETSLQALLDLTSDRLCYLGVPGSEDLIHEGHRDFVFLFKWG